MSDFDSLQQVTVLVPTGRLADFHAMYARWLAGPEASEALSSAASGETVPFGRARPDDVEKWWGLLTKPARRVFAFLAEQPDAQFSGDELAELCNIDNGSFGLAGTLSWPGKHARVKFGLGLPFEWDEESGKYSVTPEVAALIRPVAGIE